MSGPPALPLFTVFKIAWYQSITCFVELPKNGIVEGSGKYTDLSDRWSFII